MSSAIYIYIALMWCDAINSDHVQGRLGIATILFHTHVYILLVIIERQFNFKLMLLGQDTHISNVYVNLHGI